MTVERKKLEILFSEVLAIPETQITDDLAYNSISEWDSISHMALIAAIDDEYSITLDTEDIVDLSSVAKAREILNKYHVVGV